MLHNRFPLLLVIFIVGCTSQLQRKKPLSQNTVNHNRWDVKTLTDPDASNLLPVEQMTISRLVNFKDQEVGKSTERLNVERKVVKLKAEIVGYRLETEDGDIHLVLNDEAGNSMVAEVPDPNESKASTSVHADDYRKVRSWLREKLGEPTHWDGTSEQKNETLLRVGSVPATITGVVFFDNEPRADGKAANDVEIHPIINIE